MKDYRIFVGAFPTGDLAARIQAVRQRYDRKTAAITPPHVTLAGTYWRSGPATPENEQAAITRLRELEGQVEAFDLIMGRIHVFQGPNPVIYLGIQVTPGILAARAALLGKLGSDKHRDYTPHLTLAMRLNPDRASEMVETLRTSEWGEDTFIAPIRALRLMQRGPGDPAWRCIAEIALR